MTLFHTFHGAVKPSAPSNPSVIVSGAGSPEVNGTYTYRGEALGHPAYGLVGGDYPGTDYIQFNGATWSLNNAIVGDAYTTNDGPDFPWESAWRVSDGEEPAPTVTQG